jgi:hypothetical protein
LTFLTQWLKEGERKLDKESDSVELFRTQGRNEVLRRLVGLKDELREYGDKKLHSMTQGGKRA